MPNRGSDEYDVLDQTVMDEVLRSVQEGVAGDGKTFTGGGRRPNLTFVKFPAINSSGTPPVLARSTTGHNPRRSAAPAIRTEQKRLGLWPRTTMILLSGHSMDTTA